jgi:branched-chain amino acid transport system permease protein
MGIDVFKWKLLAIAVSSALTSLAGVFVAFYYNNLFPEQIFNISRSIEIILGPIIGGVGTLFGPVVGAALITFLAEGVTELVSVLGWHIPGVKQLIYGILLLIVVVFLPQGVWTPLARKLKLGK